MAPKLDLGARIVIEELNGRGVSATAIAATLSVTEGAVRYHLRRQAEGAIDGRKRQASVAASKKEAIEHWMSSQCDGPVNLAALHEWLVSEHGYAGSLRSVQRYFRRTYARPRVRARRRVETPPGAQAQADWAEFELVIGGERRRLYAFHFQLSHSRYGVVVWSERKDQVAWIRVHNEALTRIGGVPATVRIDNEKTAIFHGAGVNGCVHPVYRRYALDARFHVDACAPRSPEAKGKIERRVLDHRFCQGAIGREWKDLEELQAATDAHMLERSRKRRCPATGTSAYDAWLAEKPALGALPELPEPFDLVATRRVSADCLVSFEGRSYSVPFRFVDKTVEVRGCSGRVLVLSGATIAAVHRRHTAERIVLDPSHFEGESTADVIAPLPLGRMGRRLLEISAMEPERRPLDLYASLAEVAR
jgi:transposase